MLCVGAAGECVRGSDNYCAMVSEAGDAPAEPTTPVKEMDADLGLPAYYGAGTPQAPPSPSTPGMIKNMHHFALMDLSGAPHASDYPSPSSRTRRV